MQFALCVANTEAWNTLEHRVHDVLSTFSYKTSKFPTHPDSFSVSDLNKKAIEVGRGWRAGQLSNLRLIASWNFALFILNPAFDLVVSLTQFIKRKHVGTKKLVFRAREKRMKNWWGEKVVECIAGEKFTLLTLIFMGSLANRAISHTITRWKIIESGMRREKFEKFLSFHLRRIYIVVV